MPQRPSAVPYKLRDSPFFRLHTRKKLAAMLHVSESALADISRRNDLYVRRWKHKKDKGVWLREQPAPEISAHYRPIDIPDSGLKAVQSRIANLLSRITPPDWLFSPVKGRSYVDNAARHKGARAFWLLDIADYFPSCTANNVAHFFRRKLECSQDVTAILVYLTTWQQCLPQGSPCSPILAYFSNLDLWGEIEQSVKRAGLRHSVYADDITISGPIVRKEVIWEIKGAVHKHGLKVKAEKELSLIDSPADITGVIVVGDQTKLPNRQLKRLFDLRGKRHLARSNVLKRMLDNQIAGRIAQKRQVEQV
jgi:Reverse transcriptase (RNA-dependent DNA polymerase)